ncbi:LOW QUALITY PROTEIN: nuclear envelope pore membrane protein POM 121 [Pristis pectinata]|uniref:LOW QUALITY PROTEIN: nuclear envelope pore membrane protein POM 121 n=1 Tax=Pristis pectinata TaxID=685728 RepID=UPI00223E2A37|nr:LOW QUALITY PROTEIN: nuclear envelope pore membrane protein POM 121 [Pristis pectinata]
MSPAHRRSLITWAAGLSFALLLSFYILGWYLLGLLAAASAWVCYWSPPGGGPRPGPLVHPSRIKAFLLGSRWVEAVHGKLNGGSGQWKGRGRSTRGRSQQGPWSPSKAPGNNWRWEVNCQEDSPLLTAAASPRSSADLMMGSYLSTESSALCSKELKNRYSRSNAIQSPTRRLSFGEHQAMMNKFTVTPRRRYPIHQPQYSVPGTLPTVRWDGYQKKNVLSSRNSIMVHSPVTVKIARPDASIIRSPLNARFARSIRPMMSPAVSPLIDPCSKATVLNALKESRKRMVEDDPERSLISEHENKRRRHDSSGSGHSAFEPLLANGAPASLVPKPGTLKRGTNSQCSDDPLSKRSRTSSISSLNSICVGGKHSSVRNPIFSSYSSTRGQIQGLRNILSARNTTPLSSPASSRSETPERSGKKIREEEIQRSNASTPVRVDRPEKDQSVEEETVTPCRNCHLQQWILLLWMVGKRKRKIPLLTKGKGDQLTLHPPIELGYTITADDMDTEKRARLDRIKKVFAGEGSKLSKGPEMSVTACTGNSSTPSTSFNLSSTVAVIPTGISTTVSSSVSVPEFKPVFGLPVTQPTTITPTTLSSGMPLTTPVSLVAPVTSNCATSIIPFKPVFGNSMTPTTATTTSAPFTFGQSVQAVVNNEAPPPTTSTQSNSTLFQFGATGALTSSNIDSEVKCSKAAISFGLNETVPSKQNIAPAVSNNLSSQQQFQFGSNPSTATTAAPSTVFQFGKTSADATATTAGLSVPVFGQPKVVTSQASTGIAATSNMFGNFTPSVSTPSTTSSVQLTHTFGNSGKTSLFGNATSTPPFGAPTAFGGTSSQSLFGANAAATQQTPSKPPSFGNIVTPFNFGATPTKPAFQSTTSQSAFGTPSQPVFGGITAQTAFGSTSTQPAFGGTSVGFSFGTTTSSTAAPMFSATKSSGSGTTGSIFGSAQGFGSSSQPAITTSGFNVAASNPNIATAGFFGSGQSGFCASNPSIPFATSTPTSSSSQNMFGSSLTNQGTQNQSTPQFTLELQTQLRIRLLLEQCLIRKAETRGIRKKVTSRIENLLMAERFNFGTPSLNFGTGTTAPGFGQSTPSVNFSFGTTNTPASSFGSPGAGTATASAFAGTPSFSIGAGSRSTGGRQRLQARRQHIRKR